MTLFDYIPVDVLIENEKIIPALKILKKKEKEANITVILSCGGSKSFRLLPGFITILKNIDEQAVGVIILSPEQHKFVCIDRTKPSATDLRPLNLYENQAFTIQGIRINSN